MFLTCFLLSGYACSRLLQPLDIFSISSMFDSFDVDVVCWGNRIIRKTQSKKELDMFNMAKIWGLKGQRLGSIVYRTVMYLRTMLFSLSCLF